MSEEKNKIPDTGSMSESERLAASIQEMLLEISSAKKSDVAEKKEEIPVPDLESIIKGDDEEYGITSLNMSFDGIFDGENELPAEETPIATVEDEPSVPEPCEEDTCEEPVVEDEPSAPASCEEDTREEPVAEDELEDIENDSVAKLMGSDSSDEEIARTDIPDPGNGELVPESREEDADISAIIFSKQPESVEEPEDDIEQATDTDEDIHTPPPEENIPLSDDVFANIRARVEKGLNGSVRPLIIAVTSPSEKEERAEVSALIATELCDLGKVVFADCDPSDTFPSAKIFGELGNDVEVITSKTVFRESAEGVSVDSLLKRRTDADCIVCNLPLISKGKAPEFSLGEIFGAVVVVRTKHTGYCKYRKLIKKLTAMDVNIIGTVFNGK